MSNYTRKPRMARYEKKGLRRSLLTVLAAMLLVAVSVGGTIAWLTATTDPVTNTFTPTNIDIELEETTGVEYEMVPGNGITKDPFVTVKANSEALWLFVKIEKSANYDNYLTHTVADGWTALAGVDGVYYRAVAEATAEQVFPVLAGDKVTVNSGVTKAQMNALTEATYPKLTFTAYAIQQASFANAAAAWAELNPTPAD